MQWTIICPKGHYTKITESAVDVKDDDWRIRCSVCQSEIYRVDGLLEEDNR